MIRVAAYIDGFNLYHSLEDLKNPKNKWLDVVKLIKSYLKEDEILVKTSYFTSLSTWDEEKKLRHKRYIRALELHGVQVFYGKFKTKDYSCNNCGYKYKVREEKRTDVNLAVELMTGAFLNGYDTALLISGDSDLIPALHMIKKLYPAKKIGILFPPNRHTSEMEKASDFNQTIKEQEISKARLSEAIQLPSGKLLTPPPEWC
jgi:uncharacterized LabA/DUF88 family protein